MKAADKIRQLNKAYDIFSSPQGQIVLEDLQAHFGGSTLKKINGTIDQAGSLAASGGREVLLHILQRIHANALD